VLATSASLLIKRESTSRFIHSAISPIYSLSAQIVAASFYSAGLAVRGRIP
jgi:hypothetical protein